MGRGREREITKRAVTCNSQKQAVAGERTKRIQDNRDKSFSASRNGMKGRPVARRLAGWLAVLAGEKRAEKSTRPLLGTGNAESVYCIFVQERSLHYFANCLVRMINGFLSLPPPSPSSSSCPPSINSTPLWRVYLSLSADRRQRHQRSGTGSPARALSSQINFFSPQQLPSHVAPPRSHPSPRLSTDIE